MHSKALVEFAATARLKTDNVNVELATIKIALPKDFIGNLQPEHALLLSLSVPVRGLMKDETFEAFQFRSELDDVRFVEGDDDEVLM